MGNQNADRQPSDTLEYWERKNERYYNTMRDAFAIAVGERSPFAKQALSVADSAIAKATGQ